MYGDDERLTLTIIIDLYSPVSNVSGARIARKNNLETGASILQPLRNRETLLINITPPWSPNSRSCGRIVRRARTILWQLCTRQRSRVHRSRDRNSNTPARPYQLWPDARLLLRIRGRSLLRLRCIRFCQILSGRVSITLHTLIGSFKVNNLVWSARNLRADRPAWLIRPRINICWFPRI